MAIYYFTNAGEPCTPFEVTGEDLMKQGLAIKATVPDGVVYADGKDEAGALAQRETDAAAKLITDKEKTDADTAARLES